MRSGKKFKVSISFILLLGFLILYTITLVGPFVWGFFTSFKNTLELRDNLLGIPKHWEIENYKTVFQTFAVKYTNKEEGYVKTFYFGSMMGNSVAYAFVSALVQTTTIYVMAYATSMYKFKALKAIDVIVLVTMTLPIFGSLPSSIQIMKGLGLTDNFFGMTVVAKMSFLGTYYFVVGAAIKGIPRAYAEAASIDGANEAQIFVKVIFPLTFSMYFTIFIVKFIDFWNDWQTPYIYLRNFPTASYGLWHFKNLSTPESARLPMKLASSFVVVLPVLVVFAIFHKKLMGGISLSEGVKE